MDSSTMDYDIYCGIDVGKIEHYAVALGKEGKQRIFSGPLPQNEAQIKELFVSLKASGKVLVTVDQYGCFGRLVVASALAEGLDVAHINPWSFKKIAATYSETKTDALDAYIIADVSRACPRLIERVTAQEETIEELRALSSFRADLIKERTACYNRLHDLLEQISPPLESLFAEEKLHTELALRILKRYGGPLGLKRAGRGRVCAWASKLKRQINRGPAFVEEVFAALSLMTVILPATSVIEDQVKRLARRTLELETEEKQLNALITERAQTLPEVAIIASIPGISQLTAAGLMAEIKDISRFRNADSLASYGGVAPVRRESGTSVKGSRKQKGGNRRLKNALMQSVQMAFIHDDKARRYYDKKRAEGKSHRQALLALARRRIDLIYALLATGSLYQLQPFEA